MVKNASSSSEVQVLIILLRESGNIGFARQSWPRYSTHCYNVLYRTVEALNKVINV